MIRIPLAGVAALVVGALALGLFLRPRVAPKAPPADDQEWKGDYAEVPNAYNVRPL